MYKEILGLVSVKISAILRSGSVASRFSLIVFVFENGSLIASVIRQFGHNDKKFVRRPKRAAFDPQFTIGTVKHSQQIAVWGCFSSAGPGALHLIEGTMDRFQYREILKKHLRASVRRLGMSRRFVFQQDNDPKVILNQTSSLFL